MNGRSPILRDETLDYKQFYYVESHATPKNYLITIGPKYTVKREPTKYQIKVPFSSKDMDLKTWI